MELLLYAEGERLEKLKKVLLEDEVTSRANIVFREAGDKKGFYIRVLGSEEQLNRVLELSGELAEEVKGEEREKILKLLKEEDERMLSGFSGIFR